MDKHEEIPLYKHVQRNFLTSTTPITTTLEVRPNEPILGTGNVNRRSGTLEFLTPLIIITDFSMAPDLKVKEKFMMIGQKDKLAIPQILGIRSPGPS